MSMTTMRPNALTEAFAESLAYTPLETRHFLHLVQRGATVEDAIGVLHPENSPGAALVRSGTNGDHLSAAALAKLFVIAEDRAESIVR